MRLLALDLSLTATGYATDDGSGLFPPSPHKGLKRITVIRQNALMMANASSLKQHVYFDSDKPVDLVVIEGIAFAANASMHAEICGMHYAVQLALYEAQIPTVLIPPSTLKKFATGKGNAPKELMLVEAVKRLNYQGSDHNEADALWLREAARSHYGLPNAVPMPQANRDALAKVSWPNPLVSA